MGRSGWAALLLLAGCASATAPAPPAPPPPPPAAAAPVAALFEDPASPGPYPQPEALRSLFGEEYDRALAAIGLDRRTARVDPIDLSLVGYGRFKTPLYEALMADPTLSDRYSRTIRELAFASATGLEPASMFAAARLGVTVRMGLLGDPLKDEVGEAEKPGAMAAALEALGAENVPDAAVVPPRVQAAAALVLRAASRAKGWIASAGGKTPFIRGGVFMLDAADASLVLSGRDDDNGLRRDFEAAAANMDLRYLARAAAEVELAVDRASEWLAAIPDTGPFEYRVTTPYWTVLLRGSGDDTDGKMDRGPFLLRIDTGGNDWYQAGAAASPLCPVSVLIDVSGNDTYKNVPDEPAFGAGFFGVGLLVDLAGDDHFVLQGERSIGLGCGVFGVGALLDKGGDDTYTGEGLCEGAGAVGWGTLTDLGGKDSYDAFQFSQGFGFVLGAGVLTDLAGDDTYTLNDTQIKHPSAQSKEHNDSLGQGFGFGVRADYLDGHSMAGGVGILADREGNDRYTCGVFGQGAGYWMGVGMLLDGAGNDSYSGIWYVQGACAHFAVGILEDAAGDDTYRATMNMAQGAGHDYSLGVLLDRSGNDSYTAPNLSLGGGNSDGMGVLVDGGGDDTYRSTGTTLGLASMEAPPDAPTVRHGSLTLGVFLDLGGNDTYLDPSGAPQPFAGNGKVWRQAERAGKPLYSNQRGVGLDK